MRASNCINLAACQPVAVARVVIARGAYLAIWLTIGHARELIRFGTGAREANLFEATSSSL